MPNRPVLEICVESVDRAAAAERGGADRIELCGDLSSGGVTPSAMLMRSARKDVLIPIHVLIRPRPGDFVYSEAEFETMQRDIRVAKELGMDGIVLGLLDEARQIDRERTSLLINLAHPLPVTFHRAFDLCRNLAASLQLVMETGATRVLSSGGKARATEGLASLADLVAMAGSRIVIMPGGGVRASNIERILRETGAQEIHTSLGTPRKSRTHEARNMPETTRRARDRQAAEFEARVRKVRRLIETSACSPSCPS
jgi:copper homeostasis protein